MQPQPSQPSQPAFPPHLKAQGVELGRAASEGDEMPAGGTSGLASSNAAEDVLHEAEARSLAASLEGRHIDQEWHWAPQNGKLHINALPDRSPAAVQPAAVPDLQEPALERCAAQNGATGRQLTFRGIVFDLETTGAETCVLADDRCSDMRVHECEQVLPMLQA